MATACPYCSWKPRPTVRHPGRAVTVHMPNCSKKPLLNATGKRPFPDIDMDDQDAQQAEPSHKTPRLTVCFPLWKTIDPVPKPPPDMYAL